MPLHEAERETFTKVGAFGAAFVGVSCIVCPPFGAALVAGNGAAALGCTIANAVSNNHDVKGFTEAMTIVCTTSTAGGAVREFKNI